MTSHAQLAAQAKALYEALDGAVVEGLRVDGSLYADADEDTVDFVRPELDRAFDLIDEALEAIRVYESGEGDTDVA